MHLVFLLRSEGHYRANDDVARALMKYVNDALSNHEPQVFFAVAGKPGLGGGTQSVLCREGKESEVSLHQQVFEGFGFVFACHGIVKQEYVLLYPADPQMREDLDSYIQTQAWKSTFQVTSLPPQNGSLSSRNWEILNDVVRTLFLLRLLAALRDDGKVRNDDAIAILKQHCGLVDKLPGELLRKLVNRGFLEVVETRYSTPYLYRIIGEEYQLFEEYLKEGPGVAVPEIRKTEVVITHRAKEESEFSLPSNMSFNTAHRLQELLRLFTGIMDSERYVLRELLREKMNEAHPGERHFRLSELVRRSYLLAVHGEAAIPVGYRLTDAGEMFLRADLEAIRAKNPSKKGLGPVFGSQEIPVQPMPSVSQADLGSSLCNEEDAIPLSFVEQVSEEETFVLGAEEMVAGPLETGVCMEGVLELFQPALEENIPDTDSCVETGDCEEQDLEDKEGDMADDDSLDPEGMHAQCAEKIGGHKRYDDETGLLIADVRKVVIAHYGLPKDSSNYKTGTFIKGLREIGLIETLKKGTSIKSVVVLNGHARPRAPEVETSPVGLVARQILASLGNGTISLDPSAVLSQLEEGGKSWTEDPAEALAKLHQIQVLVNQQLNAVQVKIVQHIADENARLRQSREDAERDVAQALSRLRGEDTELPGS